MSFMDRVYNTYVFSLFTYFKAKRNYRFAEIVNEKFPGLPSITVSSKFVIFVSFWNNKFLSCWKFQFQELTARNSLVFTNSEPLVDFPRPSSARIIDIGGIAVSEKHEPVNEVFAFSPC